MSNKPACNDSNVLYNVKCFNRFNVLSNCDDFEDVHDHLDNVHKSDNMYANNALDYGNNCQPFANSAQDYYTHMDYKGVGTSDYGAKCIYQSGKRIPPPHVNSRVHNHDVMGGNLRQNREPRRHNHADRGYQQKHAADVDKHEGSVGELRATYTRAHRRHILAVQGGSSQLPSATLTWNAPDGERVTHPLGRLNSVPVLIGNKKVIGMLDTGATANCVNRLLIKDLGFTGRINTARCRVLHDAQGQRLTVLGEIVTIIKIGDIRIRLPFTVIDSLSIPLILGKPFMHQTGARMDFELVSTYKGEKEVSHMEGKLHMRDSSVSVLLTPITQAPIAFHIAETTSIQPNTEVLIECRADSSPPNYMEWDEIPSERHDWQILDVEKSEELFKKKSLIVKPSTVFRQEEGTYFLSVINPLSEIVTLEEGMHLANGSIKYITHRKRTEGPVPLPASVVLGPNPACDAPADAPCMTEGTGINAIQVLWPE